MAELSSMGWWIDHLPLVITDVHNCEDPRVGLDLILAWKRVVAMEGSKGILQASKACDKYDTWLETGESPTTIEDLALFTMLNTMKVEPGYNPGLDKMGEILFVLAVKLTVASGWAPCSIKGVRTLLKGLKKWKVDDELSEVRMDLDSTAEDSFVRIQEDEVGCENLDPRVLDTARSILRDVFPLPLWRDVLQSTSGRTGPGAVYDKSSSSVRWTAIRNGLRKLSFGGPLKGINPPLITSQLIGWSTELCESSILSQGVCRMVAVYKDIWARRLITVEQTFRAYLQQWGRNALLTCMWKHKATAHLLRGDLANPDSQVIQQALALEGSKSAWVDSLDTADRRPCTLDFSDASNRLYWKQVYEMLPEHVVEFLQVARSHQAERLTKPGSFVGIKTYAGMGNATTFVVETLIFWAVTEACRRVLRYPGKISVFGDDIIVPTGLMHIQCVEPGNDDNTPSEKIGFVEKQYKALHWKINTSKSFYQPYGRFRESCGCQAFEGANVSYVGISGYTQSVEDTMALRDKVRQIAEDFPTLAQAMITSGSLLNFEGAPEGAIDCVDIPWLTQTPQPPYRFNTTLCRPEFWVESASVVRRGGSEDGEALLLSWWANEDSTQVWDPQNDTVYPPFLPLGLKAPGVNIPNVISPRGEFSRIGEGCINELVQPMNYSYTVWKSTSGGAVKPPAARTDPTDEMPKRIRLAITMDTLPRRVAPAKAWLPTKKWGRE